VGVEEIEEGVVEPHSGVLMARRAVAATVEDAIGLGVEYYSGQAAGAREAGGVKHVTTNQGDRIAAGQFVFACGAWLSKIFTDALGARIFPSRQEVFFIGIPAGEMRFAPPALPTGLVQGDLG